MRRPWVFPLGVLAGLLLNGCSAFRPASAPAPVQPAAVVADPYGDGFEPVPTYTYLPSPTSAGERAVLGRLERELTVLERLAAEAQLQANPEARVRFRYDLLARDLEMIRLGVRQHLQAPGLAPRQFPPLRGDYRTPALSGGRDKAVGPGGAAAPTPGVESPPLSGGPAGEIDHGR